MTHESFEELLCGYLEQTLSDQQLAELHHRVKHSEAERERFQQETRLNVLLRESMAQQVELQSIQGSLLPRPKTNLLQLANANAPVLAAAAIFLASCFGYFYYQRDLDGQPGIGVCLNISGGSELYLARGTHRTRMMPDSEVRLGDKVQCGDHTQAMLQLSDGSILSMEPQSMITLVSSQPEIELGHGEVHFEIAKRDETTPAFRVQTAQSTVDVMGTVFTLSENGQTDLKVYEGRVALTRHRDNATVEVGSQQMATTGEEDLSVRGLLQPTNQSMTLLPTDDATLELGQADTTGRSLKVEGRRRKVFLRFEIPMLGEIQTAKLRLTQDIDAGSGTLRFFTCDESGWDESNLSSGTAPKPLLEIAQYRGVVRRGQTLEVDVREAIQTPGEVSIVVTLDQKKENDIWFGSRESDRPPQLILSYVP